MFPVLFEYGPITIYSLWLFIAIGFAIAGLTFIQLGIKLRYRLHFILQNFFNLLTWGIIFGRIFFVFQNTDIYFSESIASGILQTFAIWDKGISLWGFVLGFSLILILKAQKQHENVGRWFDLFTISLFIGMIFGNIGTFLEGINYGHETNLPWGVIFDTSIIQYTTPIHPTQIYAAIYCAILAGASLWYLLKKKPNEGSVTIYGMLGYGLLRILEEFFRGDEVFTFLRIRQGQWLGIFLCVTAGVFIFLRYNKSNPST